MSYIVRSADTALTASSGVSATVHKPCGGRGGLMAAAIDGAKEAGGRTVGVLPDFMMKRTAVQSTWPCTI